MKQGYKILLAISLFIFSLGYNKVKARDIQNLKELETIVVSELTCQRYHKPCKVEFINRPEVNAMTYPDGHIYITRALSDKLDDNEVLGVTLHEVGHHVLQHYRRFPVTKSTILFKDAKQIIQGFEYEADAFATLESIRLTKTAGTDTALLKITGDNLIDIETTTHPSTRERVYRIKLIKENYHGKVDIKRNLDSLLLHTQRKELQDCISASARTFRDTQKKAPAFQ